MSPTELSNLRSSSGGRGKQLPPSNQPGEQIVGAVVASECGSHAFSWTASNTEWER